MKPGITIALLTTGRQPLLWYSITSLLPQIEESNEFMISINSMDEKEIAFVHQLVRKIDVVGKTRIVQVERPLTVFEHYSFALEQSKKEIALITHDDEIYHSELIAELQDGFRDPSVSVVAGGLLKVKLRGRQVDLISTNCRGETAILDGLEWLKSAGDIFPPFCYSAVALHKKFVDSSIFKSNSTSADCLAVTDQALKGKVFHSSKVFATWLQLPSRNSRWYALRPGLIPTWKEYSEYFSSVTDPDLLQLSAAAKINAGRMFMRMLFCVAILMGNKQMIETSLQRIKEIHPLRARFLSPLKWAMMYRPLSVIVRFAAKMYHLIGNFRHKSKHLPSAGAELLKLDQFVWKSYLHTAWQQV